MKRESLYNLIKAHFSNDEKLFLNTSREISRDIAIQGDKELAIELNKLIRSNTRVTLSNCKEDTKIIIF